MAFRRQPSNPNPYPFANSPSPAQPTSPADDPANPGAPPSSRKRARAASDVGDGTPAAGDPFHHENGSDASEGSDDGGSKPDKKAGRRKIKIEFIQDKSRRHITFSKRKAGIMKKAYELSTLTGTQVLLLVVSETGLVYTFTTAKLQPLVTQPEGKNLIQACLNAPHGAMPSSLPVGAPLGRSAPGSANNAGGGIGMGGGPSGPGRNNVPGGIAIAGGDKDSDQDHQDDDGRDDGEPTAAAVARAQAQAQAHAQAQAQAQAHAQQPRRPSNASAPDDLKSPTQSHRKPSLSSQTGPGAPNPNTASQGQGQPGSASPTSPHPLSALPPLQSHHAAHYPYSAPVGLGNVNVPLDPTMYAQHHSHYAMQSAGQGAQGAQGAQSGQQAYMGGGGGHWSPTSQAGYARR